MGREGFEPSKALPADLQSVPFGHSGICPFFQGKPDFIYHCLLKADERTRTVNLLITNQLLCQLSHIGVFCFYMLHRSIGRAQASLVCSPLIDKVNKPELSHIGVLNLIACRSKTLFSRSRCNRLYNENINLTLMQAFLRLMFPSCTQSLFREN